MGFYCLFLLLLSGTLNGKTKALAITETHEPVLAQNYFIDNGQSTVKLLPKPVMSLLKKYKISSKNISVYVRDLNSPRPLLAYNVNVSRSPASTMKLLTTYAALKILSPSYSWRTEAWVRGEMTAGVLTGDLILKGYGDPFLVYENYAKFIRGLREKGLKSIQGNVIIDNSYFSNHRFDPGAFDHQPFKVYNAVPSALMFNFQSTRFLLSPHEADEQVTVTPYPDIPNFKFNNEIEYLTTKCRRSHYRLHFSYDNEKGVTIRGKYSLQCGQKFVLRSFSKPEEHAFNAFRAFWKEQGGILKGSLQVGTVQTGDRKWHTFSSSTLGEQVRIINKWSNNVMTRQVLLTLGAKKFGEPATLEKGRKAVLDTLATHQINTDGIIIDNGSGLSRISRISARQMAKVLETAYRDPYMPEFMASLSLAGLDGTLVSRFRHDDLRGRSHLKTGTLRHVTAISGYMLNRKGKRLVIVIQHNGKKVGAGRGTKIQNALLKWSFEQ